MFNHFLVCWGLIVLNCDICGAKGVLFNVEMEGSRLVACSSCSAYGKVINKVSVSNVDSEPVVSKVKVVRQEPVILVVKNYNSLIKNKRERLGLTQEELAKKLNEKESLIQQIEAKKIEPSVKVAEKLEKLLGLKLLETYVPQEVSVERKDSGPLTLGDLIEIKTRKKK